MAKKHKELPKKAIDDLEKRTHIGDNFMFNSAYILFPNELTEYKKEAYEAHKQEFCNFVDWLIKGKHNWHDMNAFDKRCDWNNGKDGKSYKTHELFSKWKRGEV